jgi:hypothetical protein
VSESLGPPTEGRPADPFGAPEPLEEEPRGDEPPRVIPLGIPGSAAEYEERKRAAERPESARPGAADAQIDYGDGGVDE